MGVQQELFETKNRPEGKGFKVVEEADGNISVYAGDTTIVGPNQVPVTATINSSGGIGKILVGDLDVTDQIGGGGDGTAGTGMTYTARNLDHASVTRIMLPSAPAELLLNWYDATGSSGNLRYVLEAASLADATARLNDDTAHGELVANGSPAIVKFSPTTFPVSIYVRASSAVGAGSNILSLLAKVTQ